MPELTTDQTLQLPPVKLAYHYEIPGQTREAMEVYRKFLGPVGFQRFEEWMRAEFQRGAAVAMHEEGYG